MQMTSGGLVVSLSRQFDGNLEAICNELNNIGAWNDDGDLFEVDDRHDRIQISFCTDGTGQHSVYVVDASAYEDQQCLDKQAADASCDSDSEYPVVPLSEICRVISPHIFAGELMIATCTGISEYCVTFETLKVRADGSGERSGIGVHSGEIKELHEAVGAPVPEIA